MSVFIRITIKHALEAQAVGKWLLCTVKPWTVGTSVLPMERESDTSDGKEVEGQLSLLYSFLLPFSVRTYRAGLNLLLNTTNA